MNDLNLAYWDVQDTQAVHVGGQDVTVLALKYDGWLPDLAPAFYAMVVQGNIVQAGAGGRTADQARAGALELFALFQAKGMAA